MSCRRPSEVAAALRIRYSTFYHIIYQLPDDSKYTTYKIPKKNGSERLIASPTEILKEIQRNLLIILEQIYKPRSSAHGFIKNRSIVSNAQEHIKRNILNIDLEDFFPSIHFGRILGLFKAKPFHFPHSVAVCIAKIACYEGTLPQGSPVSPILSNMVCSTMDKQLKGLARRNSCLYTRYADDLTFSTYKRNFPKDIVTISASESSLHFNLHHIESIIQENGFTINEQKTRVNLGATRKEVTGLTVNKKVNVRRSFARQVRGMLHSLRKKGLAEAASKYFQSFDIKKRSPETPEDEQFLFLKSLQGKIEFMGMVKGFDDEAYCNIAMQALATNQKFNFKISSPTYKAILSTLVIKTFNEAGEPTDQGTGFILSDGEHLITCHHVIQEAIENGYTIKAYALSPSFQCYSVSIIKSMPFPHDIALCKLSDLKQPLPVGLKLNLKSIITTNAAVDICGYPNFENGNDLFRRKVSVTNTIAVNGIKQIHVDAIISHGTSGGPILDEKGDVVGIVAFGINASQNPENRSTNGGNAISSFVPLLEEHNLSQL